MLPYPPFPVFTFIGFLIHAAVFYAIGFRFLKNSASRVFIIMGIASLLDAINFSIILALFFLFPNTLGKTEVFVFNATFIVPLVALIFVISLLYLELWLRRWLWLIFCIGVAGLIFSYTSALDTLRTLSPDQFSSYIHPSFPPFIGKGQGAGIVSGTLVALFFFYHAVRSSLFIRRRAIILGTGSFLLGISSFYWISTEPVLYVSMHIIGPIGSLLVAAGIFLYSIPSSENADDRPQVE